MSTRVRRGSGSAGIVPPESFPGDVIRYHGVAPERPCDMAPPDGPLFHADMDDDLLQSYLTWRREVADRGEPAPYYGFIWLRICELLNDPLIGCSGSTAASQGTTPWPSSPPAPPRTCAW